MPKKSWMLAVLWLWFCGASFDALATPDARFNITSWKAGPGLLPQGSVISLIQTRDGYLWMGTLGGLVRFDGTQFKEFDESNTPGLISREIVYLFEDSKSNLWVGTQTAGVLLIRDGRISSLDIGKGSREGRLMSACEDSTGAVWLYTADGQLARHRNGRVDVLDGGKSQRSSCRSLITESSGPMWVGMDHYQIGLNPAAVANSTALPPVEQEMVVTNKLDLLLASKKGGYWRLANNRIQKCKVNRVERDLGEYKWHGPPACACEDQEGNLIVGTFGEGLWWFDAAGNARQISEKEGLSHNFVLSLAMDREGSLWVGTDGGGLNRVKRQIFNVLEGTSTLTVQSASEDKQGGLWLNTHGGIKYLKDGVLKDFISEPGIVNGQVIFVDANQRTWAGASGYQGPNQLVSRLFQLQNDRFQRVTSLEMVNPEISVIYQDRTDKLWMGTQNGLARWDEHDWKIFTTKDGLSSDRVRAMAEDTQGNFWVGTDGGLNRMQNEKFMPVGKDAELSGEKISSLLVDEENVLWIGTPGKGLVRFKNGQWTRYGRDDGLISNGIGYLLDDGKGSLWIGSYAGLMRVPKKMLNDFANGTAKSISCRAYGQVDGLGECTAGSQPGACRTHDGKLWFPTTPGLAWVDPAQIKPNTNPPPVIIESVLVDGHLQNTNGIRAKFPGTITLQPSQEHVEIQFTCLNLTDPTKARFQYRMEGHETTWTDAGDSRRAPYSKLPPGNYTFRVKACNEDGIWNEAGSSLAFIVKPPFWRTGWFVTITTICLVGMMVGAVYYVSTQNLQRQLAGLRQQQALERERRRIARDIHDQVGASLTQVSMLGEMVESDKDFPEEVEAHGQQISQTARETAKALDEIVWAVNPSNDTLDGLITYFCKYAQEYLAVAGLRYRLDVPSQLPNTPIPPDLRHNVFLASKEAVTNIVKHAKASSVCIRLRLESDRFVLEIEDNGKGMADMNEARAKTRNGMSNMRKRLEESGGSFSIGPAPEEGTLVRLIAPLGKVKIDGTAKQCNTSTPDTAVHS
ncbi:MAG: Histidine kinase [Pedosphaera sp.]|nr:Histidine kinase [Pedosphaera sp.]